MVLKNNPNQNDAFLSYAHEDLGTLEWLAALLTSYWVPRRKRRRIFRDRERITAEGLGSQIFAALRASRYLIVCCSRDTALSTWVPQEVAAFLEDHAPEQILVCRVGEKTDPPPALPPFLESLWSDAPQKRPYVPDLRGFPEKARSRLERRRFREEALTLLAPLVGMRSKDEVLARRARRLWALAATAGALAGAFWLIVLGWKRWLTTPDGRFFDLTRNLSSEIPGQELNEPLALIPASRALGRLDRRDLLERFAAVTSDPSFRALFLAGGYASLPNPECQDARKQLALLPKTSFTPGAPEILLWVEARCAATGQSIPGNIDLPSNPESRASLLARTGFHRQAEGLLRTWTGSKAELFTALVEVTLAEESEVHIADQASFEAWLQEQDPHGLAFDALKWLAQFDLKDLLSLPMARRLQEVAGGLLSRLPQDYGATWDFRQQLAAHWAGSGDLKSARELIATTDPLVLRLKVATPRVYEDAPVGWAWRGLAFSRIGDRAAAEAAFDKAVEIASRPIPQSRSYEEWQDLALVFALAADWRRAFETFHAPADGRARAQQGLVLIELWAERKAR